jgi:hypothetical protein
LGRKSLDRGVIGRIVGREAGGKAEAEPSVKSACADPLRWLGGFYCCFCLRHDNN